MKTDFDEEATTETKGVVQVGPDTACLAVNVREEGGTRPYLVEQFYVRDLDKHDRKRFQYITLSDILPFIASLEIDKGKARDHMADVPGF
jgi:hypothetical protein